MTAPIPTEKLDAILAAVLRMEAALTGLDGKAGGIAAKVTRVEPVVGDVDTQLHRIEVEMAALKRMVARLPTKGVLIILLLATAGVVRVLGL